MTARTPNRIAVQRRGVEFRLLAAARMASDVTASAAVRARHERRLERLRSTLLLLDREAEEMNA